MRFILPQAALFLLLILPCRVTAQGDVPPLVSPAHVGAPEVEEPEVRAVVEEMPVYPGGEQALNAFLASHVKYPKDARKKGIEGRVFVRFIVGTDGTVGDVTLVRGIAGWPSMDEAALQGVRELPPFERSGRQNGKPVRVQYNVPITFKLE